MRALVKFDPDHRVTWIAHELSDDHRQYLQTGALAMVIDQDPDMQAFTALRYLVERAESNPVQAPLSLGANFISTSRRILTAGQYASSWQRSLQLGLVPGRGATSIWKR